MKTKHLRIFLLCLFLMVISNNSFSQLEEKISKRSSIFIEGLGHGLVYSINYERILFDLPGTHTTGQIGLTYLGRESFLPAIIIPICLNQSINIAENEFIEIGVGKLFQSNGEIRRGIRRDDYNIEDWVFRLGFKFYFKDGKWLFRLAYTPIYADEEILHWGGFAFGYRF